MQEICWFLRYFTREDELLRAVAHATRRPDIARQSQNRGKVALRKRNESTIFNKQNRRARRRLRA